MARTRRRKPVSGSVRARPAEVDPKKAQAAVRDLFFALGFDPDDPALATSPARVTDAYSKVLTSGYDVKPVEALGSGFPIDNPNPVVAQDIPLLFVCPHHLMPAQGFVHIAFIPNERVPGLSRLTRLVDTLGRRLVLQEDLTQDIVDTLKEALDVKAALVRVHARHTCVALEDFARRDAVFVTRASVGPARLVSSLASQIDDRVAPFWSTSASEPPAEARASRSRSASAPKSSSAPKKHTASRRRRASRSDDC